MRRNPGATSSELRVGEQGAATGVELVAIKAGLIDAELCNGVISFLPHHYPLVATLAVIYDCGWLDATPCHAWDVVPKRAVCRFAFTLLGQHKPRFLAD